MTLANRQWPRVQYVDVVDHGQVWSWDRCRRFVTLSGCHRSPTFHCLSGPIFLTCCSGPVMSGNGLAMTSGIGDDEKREVGIKQLH